MMTAKEIAARTFTSEMAANLVASRFLNAAHEATLRAEDTREELIQKIEGMLRQLLQGLRALREGRDVNSLGLCQSQAVEVDRLCGELHVASTIAGQVPATPSERASCPSDFHPNSKRPARCVNTRRPGPRER